jgi:cell division protein ZipA
MDIKDWILVGGGLLLIAVIAHGFWLAWKSRREPYKLAIDHNLIPPEDVDDLMRLRAELPNGGARVVKREPVETPPPEPFRLEADPVPALHTEKRGQATSRRDHKPAATRSAGFTPAKKKPDSPRREPMRARAEVEQTELQPAVPASEPAPTAPVADDLIVINVLARNGAKFEGIDLMAAFLRNSLQFRDMNIFHRIDPVTKSPRFSVANAVNPGTFDLAAMDAFTTPGVTFFLKLPEVAEPAATFDDMLAVARDVASTLEGDLKDEQRCVMTAQTIEHCRQRIAEYSRKRMSRGG